MPDLFDPTQNDEYMKWKSGGIKAFQIRDPMARRRAYDDIRTATLSRGMPVGSVGATLQQGRANERAVANSIGLSDTPDRLQAASDVYGSRIGVTASPSSPTWGTGGFLDPNAASELGAFSDGTLRPDQIQNPIVRAHAIESLANDPIAREAWRAKYRANMRVKVDPSVAAAAQQQIDATAGTGMPHVPIDPAVLAERKRAADMQAARSLAIRTARSISRTDPRKWDAAIARFNRNNARRTDSGEVDPTSVQLTREDLVRASRAPHADTVNPFGGITNSNAIQRPDGGVPYDVTQVPQNVVQTANGPYRLQVLDDRRTAVPTMEINGTHLPDPTSGMSAAQFEDALTQQDIAAVAPVILADKGGYGPWAMKMRAIDSAFASLNEGNLSENQRHQAEVQLNRTRSSLIRDWMIANGHNAGSRPMQDLDKPTFEVVQKWFERIKQLNPDMPDDEARQRAAQAAESEGKPYGPNSPQIPISNKREPRKREDWPDLVAGYEDALAAKTKALTAGSKYFDPEKRPEDRAKVLQAAREAFDDAMTVYKNRDVQAEREIAMSDIGELASSTVAGSMTEDQLIARISKVIADHAPAFYSEIRQNIDRGLNAAVDMAARSIYENRYAQRMNVPNR